MLSQHDYCTDCACLDCKYEAPSDPCTTAFASTCDEHAFYGDSICDDGVSARGIFFCIVMYCLVVHWRAFSCLGGLSVQCLSERR
jgi:hypothetical protein